MQASGCGERTEAKVGVPQGWPRVLRMQSLCPGLDVRPVSDQGALLLWSTCWV